MGQLRPSARSLDHEMLIFEAGRAAQGSKRPWQVMCGILTLLLCGSLIVRVPQTKHAPPVMVVQQVPAPVSPTELPPADHSLAYLNLQKTVFRRGLDALPPHRTVRSARQKRLDQEPLLKELLSSDDVYSGLL